MENMRCIKVTVPGLAPKSAKAHCGTLLVALDRGA